MTYQKDECIVQIGIPVLDGRDSISLQGQVSRLQTEEEKKLLEIQSDLIDVFSKHDATNLQALMVIIELLQQASKDNSVDNDIPLRTLGTILLSTVWKEQSIKAGAVPTSELEKLNKDVSFFDPGTNSIN